ncbi:uncharacterized protein LOC127947241 [Carassius gibelio]|uniref:uncharacterized protein LOC127947241 n=1 Tax=Carassius gibelio TaxID=101364 RepID=UPI002279728F|nr:uncharacterized protein LOC127947241 [Carassius gibelio]
MKAPQSTASTLVSVNSSSSTFDTFTTSATTVIPSTDSTASTHSPASTASTNVTVSTASTTSTSFGKTSANLISGVLTDLEFRSTDTFIDALKDVNSAEHKNRAKLVRDELEAVYRPKYANFLKVIVQGFRPGSIITSAQLVFSFNQTIPSIREISTILLRAVETGEVNQLNMIPQSILVNGSALDTTVTPAAATASTASTLTKGTTSTTATTTSGVLKIESSLLQATCFIIMSKILRLFL